MGRRLIAAIVTLSAVMAGLLGASPAVASSSPAPEPVVDGNHLTDSRTGRVFVPHGVNYPGFEYACEEDWGYSQGTETPANANALAAWHVNIVRIPLNEDCWLEHGANWGSVAGYRAAIHTWVTLLNQHGIAVILDLHFSSPSGTSVDQYPMADGRSVPFWTSVASAYADNPSVMFDAFNEPYSIWSGGTRVFDLTWDCWKNGGCSAPNVGEDQEPDNTGRYRVTGMQQLVTAIRAGGADQPIMLGGIDYSNNLTGWLAHEPDDPDGQLIASWHNYPGQDCDHTSCWTSEILPVAAQVPVIAGEFGDDNATTDFMTPFMTWADAHGIGYLPWAWWHVSAGEDPSAAIYSLYEGDDFTPEAPEGTAYYAHLRGPLPLTNVGGGLQIGTPPRNSRGSAPAHTVRSGPDQLAKLSTMVSAPARVPIELQELASLLADAPKVSSEFCAYG